MDDANMLELLEEYASDSTKAGCWQARAALNRVYGTDMRFTRLTPPEDEGRPANATVENDPEINILETTMGNSIRIFPNPSEDSFKLIYMAEDNKVCYYRVHNLLGSEVISGMLEANSENTIEGKNLKNGIYFITLFKDDKLIYKQKLVLMR